MFIPEPTIRGRYRDHTGILPVDPASSERIHKTSIQERYRKRGVKREFFDLEKISTAPTITGLVGHLNDRNTLDGLDLWTIIIEYLPPVFQKAMEELPFEIFMENSNEDILAVLLYLLLKSEYGKNLNRNVGRIVRKKFKQAGISKEHVKEIADKIEPILRQFPVV